MLCRRHITFGLAAAILSAAPAMAQTAPPLRPAPDDLAMLPPEPAVVPKTVMTDVDPYAPLGIEIDSVFDGSDLRRIGGIEHQ